jgi:hypothetical protein
MDTTNSAKPHGAGERQDEPTAEARRDMALACLFTVVGFGLVVARGGIGVMIAGSVGSVGASVVAVGLAAVDGRLSYLEQTQAGMGIVLMQLAAALVLGENVFALVGYPLLALGLAGITPLLRLFAASPRRRSAEAPLQSTFRA